MFEEKKAWGREWALGKLQADPGRKAETKQPVQSCAGQLRLECGEVKKKGPAAIPAAQNKTVFKLLAKTYSTRYLNRVGTALRRVRHWFLAQCLRGCKKNSAINC